MVKNFAVIIFPVPNKSDELAIQKEALFSEFEEATAYMDAVVFDKTGHHLDYSRKQVPLRVELSNQTIELWVCHIPDPAFSLAL